MPPSAQTPNCAAVGPIAEQAPTAGIRRGHAVALLATIVLVATCVAWRERWLQDDAFITFRYSANLVAGRGPEWNHGYAVEGYTNFLWMLVVAAGMALGLSPEVSSCAVGVACFAASLLLVYRLAGRLFPRSPWPLVAVGLVASNYTFLKYATGGLETQLDATLTLAALLVSVEALQAGRVTVVRALTTSLVLALALLTRLDSGLVVMITLACLCLVAYRSRSDVGRGAIAVPVALIVPVTLVVGTWLAWKYSFYGRLLPNTYYAKVGGTGLALRIARGLAYAGLVPVLYGWLLVAGGVVLSMLVRRVPIGALRAFRPGQWPLALYAGVWLAYVAWTGGDFMEFRMLVPVIPVLLLFVVDLFSRARLDVRGAGIACLVLVGASVAHGRMGATIFSIQPISLLSDMGSPDPRFNWKATGIALREALSPTSDVTIAVSPAGAIPFYSGLRTIDVLGLNDLWVPEHGYRRTKCRVCLAHARLATIDYMMQSGANLLIGHPQTLSYSQEAPDPASVVLRSFAGEEGMDYENLPPGTTLLRIPIHDDVAVAAVYVKPNPEIDRLVGAGTWRAQPLAPEPLVSRSAVAAGERRP